MQRTHIRPDTNNGVIITNTIIPIGIGPDGSDLFIVGTSAWNPVTQLYEENVSVTNLGTVAVYSLRLYVGHLRSGVTLYNATGTNSIGQYVEYDPPPSTPLLPGNSVTFLLEFYVANGLPFTNSLTAVAALTPMPQSIVIGTNNIGIHPGSTLPDRRSLLYSIHQHSRPDLHS